LEDTIIVENYGWVANGRKPMAREASLRVTAGQAEYSAC
jgi:hypothetical protein